jgi:hypothetical protein
LPDGLLVNRKWLKKKGFQRPLVDYYLRSGTLMAVARGVYRRPGPPLKWQHVVYSLQELNYDVHVGGRTALELQGMAHSLPLAGTQRIFLYGVRNLPTWVGQLETEYELKLCKPRLFQKLPESALTTITFGHWDWLVRYAKPELALLQLMAGVETAVDFEVADKFFEAASMLRPQLVTELLQECLHIRAKRLFMWFSERHGHSWFGKLDIGQINLGSGKRVIAKKGALDSKYLITVPKEMVHGQEQSFF